MVKGFLVYAAINQKFQNTTETHAMMLQKFSIAQQEMKFQI